MYESPLSSVQNLSTISWFFFFFLFVPSNSSPQQLDTRMRKVAVSALLVEGDTSVVAEGGKRKGKTGRKERERK